MINVSSVILSPRFAQDITIIRKSGTWEYGEFKESEEETLTLRGIITVANAKDLSFVPEADRQNGAMKIFTTEPLYVTGGHESGYSDILFWRDEHYKIYSVSPDADYGFYKSIAMLLRGTV